MTRVDFYLLADPAPEVKPLAVCKLAHKAYRLGHRIYILTTDPDESDQLDRLLWTFDAGSFIPHAVRAEPVDPRFPVLIGHDAPPEGFADVLISIAPQVPSFFDRFARVAEIVGGTDDDRARGRERFRTYRDRGHAPQTHNL